MLYEERQQAKETYDQENHLVSTRIAFLRRSEGPPKFYYPASAKPTPTTLGLIVPIQLCSTASDRSDAIFQTISILETTTYEKSKMLFFINPVLNDGYL